MPTENLMLRDGPDRVGYCNVPYLPENAPTGRLLGGGFEFELSGDFLNGQ